MSAPDLAAEDAGLLSWDARDMLDRQAEVLGLIARAAPLGDVLARILSLLEDLMPGARCSVLLLDREQGLLHHGAAPSLPDEYVAFVDGMAIGEGAGSCGTAAALNVAINATDVRSDPHWVDFRAAALAAGLQSCWSTPIAGRDGLPVGTFAVYHARPHDPTRRDQVLVDRFTHLASVAIEHATLIGDLVESEERFRRSFDDNPLGMAILGLDRSIVTSNTALTALAGGRPHLIGRPLAGLVTPKRGSLAAALDELGSVGGEPIVFEAALHRDDGSDVEVEVSASLMSGRDGGPARYVVNVLDLTERRAAERDRRARLEAETARRTAEEASRAKSELLAAVGHEARTPIQAIVGFAELLGTIDLDEAQRREALAHIDAAAGHVMDLLADVLDLSRLEAHALPIAWEPVHLRDVVVEVLGLLSSKADQRGVLLAHQVGDETVLADPRRLRQVLLNLVTNAIRHGNVGGGVEVRTLAAPADGHVLVCVDDDGPGIPPELMERLFTPFARVGTPSGPHAAADDAAKEESIGLGLGLARGLAVAMRGDLVVGRSGQEGTSMHLRLPCATTPDSALPDGSSSRG